MKTKLIKTIIFMFLSIILINTGYSNYIKNEKIIFDTNDTITLKSKMKTYCNIIKLFSNKEIINKIDLTNKIIKELTLIDTYTDLMEEYSITLNKESLDLIYKDSAENKELSLNQFKSLIKRIYKIKESHIKEFIINNLTLSNMLRTIISEELILSDKEILNFFNIANYRNYTKNFYDVHVIEISFRRKRKNNHFKIIKTLINNLEKESDIKKIKSKLDPKLTELTCKLVDFSRPENRIYYFLRSYLDNNFKENMMGPFFMDDYIYIYKIIKKFNKTENYKSSIKIQYHTLQKKKLCDKKRTKRFLEFNEKLKNLNVKKIFNSKSQICWLDREETDPIVYEKIKNLKINEVSDIIETETGWYIIKILDKIFDTKSNIYNYIVQNIIKEKVKLLTQQFEDKLNQNVYVRYYN